MTQYPEEIGQGNYVRRRRRTIGPNGHSARATEKPAEGASLRRDAKDRHEALCALVEALTASEEYSFDGQVWAAPRKQDEWAELAGLNQRTFRRLIAVPPIRSTVRGAGKYKATLLRVGAEATRSYRETRNILAKVYRDHLGALQPDVPVLQIRDFGLLYGLAEELPDRWEAKVFEYTLKNWREFMAAARAEIAVALEIREQGGDPFEPDLSADHMLETARRMAGKELKQPPRFDYPCLGFLRVFNHVAVEVYRMHRQSLDRDCPGQELATLSCPQ